MESNDIIYINALKKFLINIKEKYERVEIINIKETESSSKLSSFYFSGECKYKNQFYKIIKKVEKNSLFFNNEKIKVRFYLYDDVKELYNQYILINQRYKDLFDTELQNNIYFGTCILSDCITIDSCFNKIFNKNDKPKFLILLDDIDNKWSIIEKNI